MVLVACFLICILSVPLAGGRLGLLADYRFGQTWALVGSLTLQVLIISILPEGPWHPGVHLVSYALAFLFLLSNRNVQGLWLVGLGAAMNVTAIAANAGVMPATRSALRVAGRVADTMQFANSAALAHPKLIFLGDVFAIPAGFPLANVFSAGDVCIAFGAGLILHQVCRSRLVERTGGTKLEPVKPLTPLKPLWDPRADA